jgi:hypothetical protein
MGGREIPTLTPTLAIAGIEPTTINAKIIVPKSNFFILLPPIQIIVLSPSAFLASRKRQQRLSLF